MAFGISFVDIDLLIRISQMRNAEIQPVSILPEAGILPNASILTLPETPETSDSFSTKNSTTNIEATLMEKSPPAIPAVGLTTEKPTEIQDKENDKVAGNVFNLSPVRDVKPASNNFAPPKNVSVAPKPSETNAEIIFRSLLERFRSSVVYDYEISDVIKLDDDAERKQQTIENSSRRSVNSSENRIEADRKKLVQDKETLKQEAFRNENQSDDAKKRELWKKIEEANKFL